MDKEGALAAIAILVLAGVVVYGYNKVSTANAVNSQQNVLANQAAMAQDVIQSEILSTGSANAFNNGAAIYVANTPYLFQAPLGNIIPPNAAQNTMPGAQNSVCLDCQMQSM